MISMPIYLLINSDNNGEIIINGSYICWFNNYIGFISFDNSFILMNDTGNSFGSNPASLKGKLQTLEVHPLTFSNKSKISLMNLIIIKNKSKYLEVKKIL